MCNCQLMCNVHIDCIHNFFIILVSLALSEHTKIIRAQIVDAFMMRIQPGGVLPYMGYIGMCRPKGYGFPAILVINRVSILAILPPFWELLGYQVINRV